MNDDDEALFIFALLYALVVAAVATMGILYLLHR
jgi:hypothetical protein